MVTPKGRLPDKVEGGFFMERTFVVNTTSELFSAWLGKRPWPPYEFRWFKARPGEWLSVQPLLATGESRLASVCTACVGDYDSGTIQIDGEYEALTFDLTPLARERLEVVASLVEPALLTPFLELLRIIAERWPEAAPRLTLAPPVESAADLDAPERPAWVPKTDAASKRWARAYSTICEMREEARDTADYGDDPEPTLAEFRDRLREKCYWGPTEKTIGRIIQAGEKGWLSD